MNDYDLLVEYSRWLDVEGLIRSVDEAADDRTHDQLASDFLGSIKP